MERLLGFTYLDENKRNGYYVVTRVPERFDTEVNEKQLIDFWNKERGIEK